MMAVDPLSTTKICRLCLAQSNSYIDIVKNTKFSEMLEALTSIKVELNDEISTVMCFKCRLNLNLAYKIQQYMIKAEEKFQQLKIQSQKTEIEICDVNLDEDVIKTENSTISKVKLEESESEDDIIEINDFGEVLENKTKDSDETEEPTINSCEICGKMFPNRSLLIRHKYYHKKTKCPKCDKELTASNLHTHMEIHENDPQICDLCGVTLKTKANLRQHKYYSHNAARHKCEYCDKVFVKKSSRDAHHRKEHLDEANFVCDTCGKKFYSSRHLSIHVRMTHLKLRPYVCDFCNAGFSSNFAMKTHRRQHTNETPYRCEVCGEGFRQKVSLRSHQKSKHNIVEKETCQCTVCGKGFASKTALYTHQRIH